MSRGIIYVMTTVVDGLVKIGKTGTQHFEQRMYNLERNGYCNVAGLKRAFAIEVEDYDEKEELIDEIFSKSCVPGTELFALDIDLVIQLLSSFEGKQIYPKTESKEEIFDRVTEDRRIKEDWSLIPDGEYYLKRKTKKHGILEGKMLVKDGAFIVKAGSACPPLPDGAWQPEARKNASIVDDVLIKDCPTAAPSTAAWIVLGHSANGWVEWRDASGKTIDHYRKRSRS